MFYILKIIILNLMSILMCVLIPYIDQFPVAISKIIFEPIEKKF